MSALPPPAARLAERLQRYAAQPGGLAALNGDQVTQIMRQVRRLLEADRIGDRYPHAKLFADWLQHVSLNNAIALGLLEAVNLQFIEDGPLELVVPHLLGLIELRQELAALCIAYGLSDDLFQTGSLWMIFAGRLLEEIADVPISFPENATSQSQASKICQRIWDAAMAADGGAPRTGDPLWFDRLLVEVDESTDDFHWRLEFALSGGDRCGVRGRLYMTDNRGFRYNDLGLRSGDEAAMRKAAQQVVDERPSEMIFSVSKPEKPATSKTG